MVGRSGSLGLWAVGRTNTTSRVPHMRVANDGAAARQGVVGRVGCSGTVIGVQLRRVMCLQQGQEPPIKGQPVLGNGVRKEVTGTKGRIQVGHTRVQEQLATCAAGSRAAVDACARIVPADRQANGPCLAVKRSGIVLL